MRDLFGRFDRGEPGMDLELSRWSEERPFWQHNTVLYSALAVESWLNFYGLRKLGPERFGDLDRLAPPSRKLRVLLAATGAANLPERASPICKAVDRLFALRNAIVHSRSGKEAHVMLADDPELAVQLMDEVFALFIEHDATMARDIQRWFGSQEFPPRASFTATFRNDQGNAWSVVADCGEPGVAVSDGPTLEAARGRLREAIALLVGVPEDSFDLIEELARDVDPPRGE
jgi:predicted RNase H-like HicB family nuclease